MILRLFPGAYCAAFRGVARKPRGLGAGGSLTRDPRIIQTRGVGYTTFLLLLHPTYIFIPYWYTEQHDRDYPHDCSISEFSTCLAEYKNNKKTGDSPPPTMGDVSGICFDADLGMLICQVHGAVVRPGAKSIARHLRSPGHELSGKIKTKAIATLASLPLRSIEEVKRSCPSACLQPVSPVPYVKVLDGWSCVRCRGNTLTTNHETIRRHVSDKHGRTAADHSVDKPLWEGCSLQTLVSATNDTHYFRVKSDPQPSRATTAAAT
jgi:hypothetical protein